MSDLAIMFADVITKQLVQEWGIANNQDAEELIAIHFQQERFGVNEICVGPARVNGTNLLFQVVTDQWSGPREFALSPGGSLMW